MNNIMVSLKKFFTNKNTVTVIGVLVIIGVLFWGYTSTINSQVEPIRIPVATETIQPRQLITAEMIEFIEVPSVAVTSNVIRNSSALIGSYSNINTVIPAGSMFYSDTIIDESEIPGSEFAELEQGERPYSLAVTLDSTYGNSLKPGDIIDIYMKANDEIGKVMIGKLLGNVEILAVKDSSGNDVFENTDEDRNPDSFLIAVDEETFILLKKSEYLRSLGVELFPVPIGGTPPEGDLVIGRTELVEFINANTVTLSEENPDVPEDETEEDETE